MKRLVVGLTALMLLLGACSASAFGGGGGHCAPPSYGGYGGYSVGCGGVSYQYVTQYQEVQRTVCEWVPVTTNVTVPETVSTPVTTTENRTETYYETVME